MAVGVGGEDMSWGGACARPFLGFPSGSPSEAFHAGLPWLAFAASAEYRTFHDPIPYYCGIGS
ncbi:hypothetical protein [Paenibacillus uliginis]|uniref:hypothetical protein n=1 Tax=Paenibacillus uliginis TaxID=683737 RepID=UPI001AD83BDA|nr:hypothetical protein [Paenibacillus uliginis]